MEIGNRIREHRMNANMSQDDLAARVYVSRQTISSWENDKTYPDIQSLLLLSEIFGATVDELVKGDVETMEKSVEKDIKTLNRLGITMTAFVSLAIAAITWFTVQSVVWDWPVAQTLPTLVLAIVLWGIAMAAGIWAERIKRENDVVTYSEVVSFVKGEPVDRETERGRRARLVPKKARVARIVTAVVLVGFVGACAGAAVAFLAI